MNKLLLVLTAVFGAAAVGNAVYGNFTHAGRLTIVAMLFGGILVAYKAHQREQPEFEAWLADNVERVVGDGALFKGVLITKDTELARFYFTLSLVVISFQIPSRFYIVGHEPTGGIGAAYSIASLALGWWGFPWGPIYTVQAVRRNLRGGERATIAELLLESDAS